MVKKKNKQNPNFIAYARNSLHDIMYRHTHRNRKRISKIFVIQRLSRTETYFYDCHLFVDGLLIVQICSDDSFCSQMNNDSKKNCQQRGFLIRHARLDFLLRRKF